MRNANWTDRQIHTVIKVNTCGSCIFSIPSPVIDNFDLHIFQFNMDFVIFESFPRFSFSQQPRPLAGQCYES